jgi:hypothetical protein
MKNFRSAFAALLIFVFIACSGCATTKSETLTTPTKGSKGSVEDKKSSLREIGILDFVAYNAEGDVIWTEHIHNAIADEGEQNALQCWLAGTNCAATNYYLGLSDSTSPCSIAEADNLATASTGEPSTNGYARQTIAKATDWTIAQISSGTDGCTETNCYRATSATKTFSASGGSWGPVNCAFLGTSSDNTGKHISWAALSTSRTLNTGESLQVTYKIVLQ